MYQAGAGVRPGVGRYSMTFGANQTTIRSRLGSSGPGRIGEAARTGTIRPYAGGRATSVTRAIH
jgi:hypothetical protein